MKTKLDERYHTRGLCYLVILCYNDVDFETVSGTGSAGMDTITDYTAARVATVTGTYSSDTVFGTISKLPEEAHELMCISTALLALAKPSSKLDEASMKRLQVEEKQIRAHGWE